MKNPINIAMVKRLLQEKNLTSGQIKKHYNISPTSLRRMLDPMCNSYKIITFEKLCVLLNLSPFEIVLH